MREFGEREQQERKKTFWSVIQTFPFFYTLKFIQVLLFFVSKMPISPQRAAGPRGSARSRLLLLP